MEKEKENIKRKRSENWTEEDKILLKELIRKRVKTIENKNTDTNSNQTKKKAWVEVMESFNALCSGGQRTLVQLKTQWTATKIVARKQVAEHRKEILKTGGGSQPQDVPICSSDISVWLPNEFVIDHNEFDSDSTLIEIIEEAPKSNTDENDFLYCIEEEGDVDEKKVEAEEAESTHTKFVERPKPATTLQKKTQNIEKYKTNYNIKRLADFDIECKRELHYLEMKCRQDLHEQQLEVEKKKLRNLDRELELINKKIEFQNKNIDNHK